MTLYTPQPSTPHQGRLLAKMQADLQVFTALHGGDTYIADSDVDSLHKLATGPGQFIVTIHSPDDRPDYGDGPRISDPVIWTTIAVRILHNGGFDPGRGSSLAIEKSGIHPLLWLVSEIRKRILSYRITPEVVNNGELYYEGRRGMVLPSGEPLSGYELTFGCYMHMALATSDQYKPINLDT